MGNSEKDAGFFSRLFKTVVIQPTNRLIQYFQEALTRGERSQNSQLIAAIISFLILSFVTFFVALLIQARGYGFSAACLLNIATEFAAASFLLFVINIYLGNENETRAFRDRTQTQLNRIADTTEAKLSTLERKLLQIVAEQNSVEDITKKLSDLDEPDQKDDRP